MAWQVRFCLESRPTEPFTLRVHNCPRYGVDALLWKRERGLPETPDDTALVPPLVFTHETFVRAWSKYANHEGDLCLSDVTQDLWSWTEDHEHKVEIFPQLVVTRRMSNARGSYCDLVASAHRIANYLACPNPATCMTLFRNILEQEKHSETRLRHAQDVAARQLDAYWIEVDEKKTWPPFRMLAEQLEHGIATVEALKREIAEQRKLTDEAKSAALEARRLLEVTRAAEDAARKRIAELERDRMREFAGHHVA